MACEDFPCCGHEMPSDCSMTDEQYEAERKILHDEAFRDYWK